MAGLSGLPRVPSEPAVQARAWQILADRYSTTVDALRKGDPLPCANIGGHALRGGYPHRQMIQVADLIVLPTA
ncbi:hypothetical protein ABZW18_34300 [Streptomyces sp. NPDC004647]|uniref:hypothetical protein n=1 Tax=Streptomyces sp. NPDC004647 TaxID=3154671 RepID=UPI0033AEB481